MLLQHSIHSTCLQAAPVRPLRDWLIDECSFALKPTGDLHWELSLSCHDKIKWMFMETASEKVIFSNTSDQNNCSEPQNSRKINSLEWKFPPILWSQMFIVFIKPRYCQMFISDIVLYVCTTYWTGKSMIQKEMGLFRWEPPCHSLPGSCCAGGRRGKNYFCLYTTVVNSFTF